MTFTGPDLDAFSDKRFDLRIKMIFPDAGGGFAHLQAEPDWYRRWRELPDEHRNPIRTFTARAVRAYAREVDVDMVVHGDGDGPASVWARDAAPGDPLMLLGPNAAYQGEHGGVAFRPPAPGCTVLLAGDETAVPAIGAILERLPSAATWSPTAAWTAARSPSWATGARAARRTASDSRAAAGPGAAAPA